MCIPTIFLTRCWSRSFFFLSETRLRKELECCEESYEAREASPQFFDTRFHIFFMLKARTWEPAQLLYHVSTFSAFFFWRRALRRLSEAFLHILSVSTLSAFFSGSSFPGVLLQSAWSEHREDSLRLFFFIYRLRLCRRPLKHSMNRRID